MRCGFKKRVKMSTRLEDVWRFIDNGINNGFLDIGIDEATLDIHLQGI